MLGVVMSTVSVDSLHVSLSTGRDEAARPSALSWSV